jgi:aspartate ammonia-lyase
MRTEKDFLGEKQIPDEALYGIHSIRARENFPDMTPFPVEWYKAMAIVKRACYFTTDNFYKKAEEQFDLKALNLRTISSDILNKLSECALECENGIHFDQFIVPAISGGAGTSINMNVNEIITNLALIKSGKKPGDYSAIDPVEHANIFQSTNDVVPTSLRVALMKLLLELEESINSTRALTEKMENEYRHILRIGYTQMQEAVPTTYGRLFSTYNEALSRDWWRVSKCLERIKMVNLGGSAIGSSITVPKYFVSEVVKTLQQLTGLPVTRGENLYDATNNLDTLVEVHGIIKSHAVNLEKMVNDLRLLASDIGSTRDLEIPNRQVGSSIMPGKINPVVPEFVISSVYRIYCNDSLVTLLAARGCLELNAYLPVIGCAMIESLKLLLACNLTIRDNLLTGLTVDTEKSILKLLNSPAVTTALIPYIGYNKASDMAKYMKLNNAGIFEANKKLNFIDESKLTDILKPENLIQGGFTLKELLKDQKNREL